MTRSWVLRVEGVRRSFGRRSVLRGVSLEVAPGALVGIVGENGTGKSTLLRVLAGILRPSAGGVAIRGTTGYCPQQPVLNSALTVRQHLRLFQVAYGLASLDRAHLLLDTLNFGGYIDEQVKNLSGGTQQKLNLTIALMHDPAVLLLDEPYQGFDWETYLRFWQLAEWLRAEGRAVLVISHLVFDRDRLDAVYHLRGGVLEAGPPPAPAAAANRTSP